ncbi:MAG: hypothetical protein EOO24_30700 [Comamonadaceae bacterium]|nr:MAG: hypothetical protein EOO24_30700 [Comamonadaceae bacterium]
MSANPDFGFGKFVPGFDFLQNLAKGTAQAMPQVPGLSNWVAPTLNVEELEKRISELKAVQFWLDQNGKALAATIQALEVQKMTLATLNDMNVNMSQVADALKARTADAMAGMQKMSEAATGKAQPAAKKDKARPDGDAGASTGAAVDPLQWWGALTHQFQQIAANALQDAGQKPPAAAKAAPAAPASAAAPAKAPARKSTARKRPSPR